MEPIIKLENVEKTYKVGDVSVKALDKVNLDVYKNDFIAIQGQSGSGKSTIVNMIGCLDTPSKGEIYLEKHNIAKLSESNLAQIRGRKIGLIFQTFNLIPSLTSLENVALPMTFQNKFRKARLRKAAELLKQVGLGDRMDHFPNQLSGGQRQRVAIARALINDPEIILADEPTGNLDTKTGNEIMKILLDFNKQGKTIILVTHNSDLTKSADRIITLKDGKIIKGKAK